MGWTNRGMRNVVAAVFRGESLPANFYVALVTSASTPTADTNVFSELTEIATGNGYTTGGYALDRNSTDFDALSESDVSDYAYVQAADVAWTASGGAIPSAGNGARYAVLLDDNTTVANREVWAFWDLTADRSVSEGQTLTLTDLELRLSYA